MFHHFEASKGEVSQRPAIENLVLPGQAGDNDVVVQGEGLRVLDVS